MWFLFLLLTIAAGIGLITSIVFVVKKRRKAWLGVVASVIVGAISSVAFLVAIVMTIPIDEHPATASNTKAIVKETKSDKAEDKDKEDKEEGEKPKKSDKPKEKGEDSSDEKEVKKKKEEVKKEDKKKNDITDEEYLKQLVNDTIGGKANTKEKRVEDVTYNEIDAHPYIGLNLHADENLTLKLTRAGMLKHSTEIMEALHKEGYEGKFYVEDRLPLTDNSGNVKPVKVMSIDLTAEDFTKINFDNFNYNNLP